MSMRIQVDGVGEVEVDPSFSRLSPEEQNALISEIQQSVSSGRLASDAVAPAATPINASRQDFDLDAAIPDEAPEADTPLPPVTAPRADALQGTPFDYDRGVPILESLVSDLQYKENLRTGAKYGDKAMIEEDWRNTVNNVYAPQIEELGLMPAQVENAAQQVVNRRANNIFEALGIPEQKSEENQDMTAEQLEKAIKLQNFVETNLNLATESEDPKQKRTYQRMAADATRDLRQLRGIPEPSPYEKYEGIRSTLEELNRKKERGGAGTVEYDGVSYPVSAATELEQDLVSEQADLLDRLQTDPEARNSLRVSMKKAAVFQMDRNGKPKLGKDGNPLIDPEATAAKYDELYASAKPGEIIEKEDGSIGQFVRSKNGGDQIGSLMPKRLQPAVKGAGVVGSKIVEAVAPLMTEDNIAAASNLLAPGVGEAGVRMAAYAARDPKQAVAKATRGLYELTMPGGLLAMKGLDYLSAVGRKAEEEEQKKRAGQ